MNHGGNHHPVVLLSLSLWKNSDGLSSDSVTSLSFANRMCVFLKKSLIVFKILFLFSSKLTLFTLPAGYQRVEHLPFKHYFGYC